jgi:hypothetical protein
MREALFGGASGASSLFDEIAKNVVVDVFSGITSSTPPIQKLTLG